MSTLTEFLSESAVNLWTAVYTQALDAATQPGPGPMKAGRTQAPAPDPRAAARSAADGAVDDFLSRADGDFFSPPGQAVAPASVDAEEEPRPDDAVGVIMARAHTRAVETLDVEHWEVKISWAPDNPEDDEPWMASLTVKGIHRGHGSGRTPNKAVDALERSIKDLLARRLLM